MSATTVRKRSIFDDSDSDDDLPVVRKVSKKVCQKSSLDKCDESKLTKNAKCEKKNASNLTKGKDIQKTPEKVKDGMEDTATKKIILSPAQRARMEQNRQKALIIKHDKINKRTPYTIEKEKKAEEKKVIRINDTKLIDTGAGFFIEEGEGVPDDDMLAAMKLVTEPAPLIEEDRPHCVECDHPFNNSFLFHSFDYPACDQCRDNDDKHCLITKTDAKNEYLLKDVDLEKRPPPLKFIVRKNPHNSNWGDMKLFLKCQVEKRALEMWGTEEALEEAMVKKEDERERSKQKKFNKKMKELRMNVRSSLYTRASKNHEHEYGEEEYLPDEDEYSRTCKTCGHSYTYDKL